MLLADANVTLKRVTLSLMEDYLIYWTIIYKLLWRKELVYVLWINHFIDLVAISCTSCFSQIYADGLFNHHYVFEIV